MVGVEGNGMDVAPIRYYHGISLRRLFGSL
jgi:hypothetical protein